MSLISIIIRTLRVRVRLHWIKAHQDADKTEKYIESKQQNNKPNGFVDEVLHNGENNTISQSEYDEKIKMNYSRKGEISRTDVHLFGTQIEDY
jgi:hypothetical protein